jgi:hypothetical protein
LIPAVVRANIRVRSRTYQRETSTERQRLVRADRGGPKVNLGKVLTHWPDMLRVTGSPVTGQVRA